ncbi:MAG: hypothetical protein M0017_04985 [Desulfobacteraceae bacterium]|nr:hypothetical protein [Desulfobacteraceae bacterium]
MARKIILILLFAGIVALVAGERLLRRPSRLYQTTTGNVEMCLSCHQQEKLDPAHDTKILGCSSCHLGNPLAINEKEAHQGIVKNPGDLRVVERTCGNDSCHASDVKRVKNSLMATNRGILATLRYYWKEAPNQNGDFSVEKLMKSGETSLAIDYYRKLCGTCHLWKQKGDMPGFFGEKGGGCTACHHVVPKDGRPIIYKTADGKEDRRPPHPFITKKIPIANCVRCHNRSGRVGISYQGQFESEGYGTPYEKGGLSSKQLPGDRFYLELSPDIHHEKGMACIDCHTRDEIMGDGHAYAHYEQQLEISCGTCHTSGQPGLTRRNHQLNNIAVEGGKVILTGKLDGKKHLVLPPKKGTCDYPGHKRLSCDSCHSTWVPQCYGCHVKRDMRETHLDKLSLKDVPGWWQEGRSYLRYEQPMLAVWGKKVVIVTPGCQDIVTLINKKGKVEKGFNSFTMAALSPHTTQAKGRSCADCHTSPKTLGLGEGTLWRENGTWKFQGLDQGVETLSGKSPPLDGYVTIDGKPLQKSSRPDLRPFNGEELSRILRVGECLPCHKSYDDPAYKDYRPDRKCPKGNF